jgi:hypothetical protein
MLLKMVENSWRTVHVGLLSSITFKPTTMKNYYLSILFFVGLLSVYGQEKVYIITKEFAYKNFPFQVTVTTELEKRGDLAFKILQDGKTDTFTMVEMKADAFLAHFYNSFLGFHLEEPIDEASIKRKAQEVFDAFQNELSPETSLGPLAGRFTVEREALGYYLFPKSSRRADTVKISEENLKKFGSWTDTAAIQKIAPEFGDVSPSMTLFPTRGKPWARFDRKFALIAKKFTIDSLQIEFNDSNIKNMKIVAHDSARKIYIFHNPFPVPVSSFKELQLLDGYVISNNLDHVIPLRNLMRYDPELSLEGQDYSPDNSVYYYNFSKPALAVHKENLSRVLDARIYTDFLGVNKDNPNGLLQFEIGKKINRRAERIELYGKLRKSLYPLCGISLNSYVYPYFTFTKIEQNNKFFGPTHDTDTINTIDLIRYGDLFAGAKIGLMTLEAPNSKTIFSLELTPQISRFNYETLVGSDSIPTDTVSRHDLVFAVLVGFNIRLLPDSRYGLTFTAFTNYMNLQSDRLKQSNDKYLLGLGMEGFIKAGSELRNKLFFRVRYFTTYHAPNKTLLQLQFGWAFDIVKSKLN